MSIAYATWLRWPARARAWLRADLVSHLLFWTWNGIFLLFVFGGLAPTLGVDFARDVMRGRMPWDLAASLGTSGRRRVVEGYSAVSMVEKMESLYDRMLDTVGRR